WFHTLILHPWTEAAPSAVYDAESAAEVVIRVRRASGIERGTAFRAGVDALVRIDRQFGPAHSAQDRRLVPLRPWPLFGGVVGRLRMTQMARKVPVAAEEADRDDVEFGSVVDAPRVLVDRFAVDAWRPIHRTPAFRYPNSFPFSLVPGSAGADGRVQWGPRTGEEPCPSPTITSTLSPRWPWPISPRSIRTRPTMSRAASPTSCRLSRRIRHSRIPLTGTRACTCTICWLRCSAPRQQARPAGATRSSRCCRLT